MLSRVFVFITSLLAMGNIAQCDVLTSEQLLVVACHRVDVESVVTLLRSGTDVNAKFGAGDTRDYFQDSWSGGWPMTASEWTPLLALANSSRYPESPRPYENTLAHLDWVNEGQSAIPKEQIEQRDKDRVLILQILLSHKCDIDAADSRGATPLYCALYRRHADFVELLLRFKPKVNTKTGIYIDGTADITPLHRASWSPELARQLIELGADDSAKDGAGRTPADWRKRDSTGLGGAGFQKWP